MYLFIHLLYPVSKSSIHVQSFLWLKKLMICIWQGWRAADCSRGLLRRCGEHSDNGSSMKTPQNSHPEARGAKRFESRRAASSLHDSSVLHNDNIPSWKCRTLQTLAIKKQPEGCLEGRVWLTKAPLSWDFIGSNNASKPAVDKCLWSTLF